MNDVEEQLLLAEELGALFQRTHLQEVSKADEFYMSMWQRIHSLLSLACGGWDWSISLWWVSHNCGT